MELDTEDRGMGETAYRPGGQGRDWRGALGQRLQGGHQHFLG